jgi:hypothetical protein
LATNAEYDAVVEYEYRDAEYEYEHEGDKMPEQSHACIGREFGP